MYIIRSSCMAPPGSCIDLRLASTVAGETRSHSSVPKFGMM